MNQQVWNSKSKGWYTPTVEKPILIGNTDTIIDWNDIINNIKDRKGKVLPNLSWDNRYFNIIKEHLTDSNYCKFSTEWINYYPNVDFDETVVSIFGNFIGFNNHIRSWISRINPGKTAPWHWDIDDDEEKYLQSGDVVRFVCNISEHDPAHITQIGNHVLDDTVIGNVYRWIDHRQWHGSANAGLIPKYQFNYLSYKNNE